jgi:hypothetical protein
MRKFDRIKNKQQKVVIMMAAAGMAGVLAMSNAYAATQAVTANIAFDTPLSLTKNSDINFGTVKAGVASTYTISTANSISATGGGQWLYGTPAVGDITIAGSATQVVNISVGGYTANGGVIPSNAQCAYDGGAEGSCTINSAAAPGAGKTLLVGVDAAADGTQVAADTATPSFTVTVVYP